MQIFATDYERLAFLLEADAELAVDTALGAMGADQKSPEELPAEERPKYITNYIGSKQKLVDWIWKHTPESAKSVVDAFSGSSAVSYMFKSKGLQVFANDRLRYCYHGARAIVENSSTRLSDEEIDKLLAENPKAGTFVQDNFKGLFFSTATQAVIDSVRANCDALSGYKKDIALFALGKTCASGGFGHFTSSTETGMRKDSPDEFRARMRKNIERINALIFDNGKENKASQKDVNELLPSVNTDLAYFDPPYATEFSTTNYEKAYHFVEGLMTNWAGLKIVPESKTKVYETDHVSVTKANAQDFFQTFLGNAKHIGGWLISYRDHAYPNEQEMKKIIASLGRDSAMKSKDHHYSITAQHGEASQAKERLFVCSRSKAGGASASDLTKPQPLAAAANFHTSIPVTLDAEPLGLSAQAMDSGSLGDPQFTFILCRTGTNRNGDNFTADELRSRHMTAVNKKVDLQHSQDFSDIVGGIVAADFLDDENGGRVECVGELYSRDSANSQLAYKLMKRGIITQVSMECDYEEGECSICAKRFKSKADYCTHLRKFKGGEFNGKPVFEILHGVTFTGLGLLDRKGADENARILQVASVNTNNQDTQTQGESPMDDNAQKQNDGSSEAAKKGTETPPAGGGGGASPSETELQKENKTLKAQVAELQKKISELEAAQKAAANRSRAEKLIAKLEKMGIAFASEDERKDELNRLADLTDEAFAATEAAFSRIPKTETKSDPGKKGEEKDSKEQKAPESNQKTEASFRPRDIDDSKASLEDRLKSGFMAAYRSRVGSTDNRTTRD